MKTQDNGMKLFKLFSAPLSRELKELSHGF